MQFFIQLAGGLLLGLMAAVSPGPDTLLVLRSVAAGGARTGARAALGIGAALLVHAGVTTSLAVIARGIAGGAALTIVQLAGSGYLAFLGAKLIWSGLRRATGPSDHSDASPPNDGYFIQGFITNLTNPKALIFFGSIVSQFMSAKDAVGGAVLLLGVVLAIPAWFLALSFASAALIGKASPRWRRTIDIAAGACFLALALYGASTARFHE